MRFLVHGAIHPDAQAALVKQGHACHALLELSEATDAPNEAADKPSLLLPLLEKKQWNLVTTDAEFIHTLYEEKQKFEGLIVLILDDAGDLHDQGKAIDRLFERYPRLTAKRMYTVTPSRVKIRQLPGGGGGRVA
jgi:hypothetical protein